MTDEKVPPYFKEVDMKTAKGGVVLRNGKAYVLDMKHPEFRKKANEGIKRYSEARAKINEKKEKEIKERIQKGFDKGFKAGVASVVDKLKSASKAQREAVKSITG